MNALRRWFARFWSIAGAVNIRVKMLGIVLALVLLLGLTVTAQVRAMLTQAMDAQLEEQAVSVARDVAARATDLILINTAYALYQLLQDTKANNPNVRYAFIVAPDGQVLAHTFGAGFPAALRDANAAAPDAHHQLAVLDTDEGRVWDVAVPVFEGRAGTARVGLSEVNVHRTRDAITGQLLLTTVLVSVAGVTAATALTWALTRPILALVRATQAVARGDFSPRVPRWADDEIGDLADAFNAMTAALAQAEEERAGRDQLRAQYVSGVIAAQEEERRRIARELHDSASQTLTSLVIGLRGLSQACDRPDVRQRAEELRAVAGLTLEEVHALALQLRPRALDDLGLAAALERHVADCRRRYDLDIDLAVHGLERRLPPEVETALYRIVQEALTNVARHAGAHTASVLIERRERGVRAVIDDDGAGFDPCAAGGDGHLGLYGIRERAELLGGAMTIESEPGRGTSLFVEIPLPPDGEAHE